MPHSSGGGSHSGGRHSGVSSTTSSFSRRYYKGAARYLYYKNNKPKFFYTNQDITKEEKTNLLMYSVILAFIFAICFLYLMHWPVKLRQNYDTKSFVMDKANVIKDAGEVYGALDRFLEKTGISASVLTVYNSDWENDYENLEKYAYDRYIDFFGENEKHWLIVYSSQDMQSQGESSADDFENWSWEGMQGDKTDRILGDEEVELFNECLHKALLQREKYDVGQAITLAFDTLTPVVMKIYISKLNLWILIILFAVVWLNIYFDSRKALKIQKIYKISVECPENFTDQEKCLHCGGIYIKNFHTNCPHCGAEI